MTAIPVIQPSFAAGELSPFLYGRVDLAKFHVGARTMLNFLVHAHGGASNRPGTRFVGEVDDSSARHRLIPFQFRTLPSGQTYVLAFGDKTMQVAMQSGPGSGADWGFVCPCHGSTFDLAGRVYKAKPAPDNLRVPPHMYLSETKIIIGDDKKGA